MSHMVSINVKDTQALLELHRRITVDTSLKSHISLAEREAINHIVEQLLEDGA